MYTYPYHTNSHLVPVQKVEEYCPGFRNEGKKNACKYLAYSGNAINWNVMTQESISLLGNNTTLRSHTCLYYTGVYISESMEFYRTTFPQATVTPKMRFCTHAPMVPEVEDRFRHDGGAGLRVDTRTIEFDPCSLQMYA